MMAMAMPESSHQLRVWEMTRTPSARQQGSVVGASQLLVRATDDAMHTTHRVPGAVGV